MWTFAFLFTKQHFCSEWIWFALFVCFFLMSVLPSMIHVHLDCGILLSVLVNHLSVSRHLCFCGVFFPRDTWCLSLKYVHYGNHSHGFPFSRQNRTFFGPISNIQSGGFGGFWYSSVVEGERGSPSAQASLCHGSSVGSQLTHSSLFS